MAMLPSVVIVGAGNVGCVLGRFLYSKGLTISALIERDGMKLDLARSAIVALAHEKLLSGIPEHPAAVLLCVQDQKIAVLAEKLAALDRSWEGVFVAHTSGMQTSDDLRPLLDRGAVAGSFHPIQSFPSPYIDVQRLHGIGCGIEGDGAFLAQARDFAAQIGWEPVVIRKQQKALYHLACVYAGNFITTLAADSLEILRGATSEDADLAPLMPMIQSVLSEILASSPRGAFTGPVARGDAASIETHIAALTRFKPELLPLYLELVRSSLRLATLPEGRRAEVLDVLARHAS
ncbi:MAG: DUF2520 domain-containing protein [Ignavibacteria bacterium]|nr:DUF2520 domain-containing protein [Ignavibacteria bacterium]